MELKSLPVKIRNGVTIHVPNSPNVLTSYVLLEQEAWFEDEVAFVSQLLQPGECAVDIGANFGVYTTAMAERVGAQGTVFAFEPASETCTYLRATAALRHAKTVQVVQAALSNRGGTADLLVSSDPELNALATSNNTASARETVRLLTLDEYLADWRDRKLSVVKVDAEGHEHQVIAGAREALRRDEPVIMFEIRLNGKLDLTLLDTLQPLGFTGFSLVPGLNILVPFERDGTPDKFQLNLFAATERRATELERRGLLVRQPGHVSPTTTSSLPAMGEIVGGWTTTPAAREPYAACLAHYAQASSTAHPGDQITHLFTAIQLASQACQESRTIARLLTFARLAGIFGLRAQVVRALVAIADDLMRPGFALPAEPFLRPGRSLASSSKDDGQRTVATAALEALERARRYSSFFGGTAVLPLLDHLCRQPDCSPEMQRRRQLVRMRAGLQWAPEPHPQLARDTADNLNAWFWNTVR